MEKIISIDGVDVGFKATASTIKRYRQKFNSDFLKDIQGIMNKMSGTEEMVLSADDLDCFEKVAYIMAWQYDNSIAPNIEDWLDQFEMFSLYQVLPEIIELWHLNAKGLESPKKKAEEQSEN